VSELREGAGSGSSRLILVHFLFPFICRVVLSGSSLLLFGGASDDEQRSKEGDYRRGKFHRIAFVGFCCEPGNKSNILILAYDLYRFHLNLARDEHTRPRFSALCLN
jgi:hypothetical protein